MRRSSAAKGSLDMARSCIMAVALYLILTGCVSTVRTNGGRRTRSDVSSSAKIVKGAEQRLDRELCMRLGADFRLLHFPMDAKDCADGFALLRSLDEGTERDVGLENHLMFQCSINDSIARYGKSVIVRKTSAPDAYRDYMERQLLRREFQACRDCVVLGARDLGLSFLLDAPTDGDKATHYLRQACSTALQSPVIIFADNRGPCSFLDSRDPLFRRGEAASAFGRKVIVCSGLVPDVHVLEETAR